MTKKTINLLFMGLSGLSLTQCAFYRAAPIVGRNVPNQNKQLQTHPVNGIWCMCVCVVGTPPTFAATAFDCNINAHHLAIVWIVPHTHQMR